MARLGWISLSPCLMRRQILGPETPEADAPLAIGSLNDVRLGTCKIDLDGFVLALAATGLCPSVEDARARIEARIVGRLEDIELAIGELLTQRVIGRKSGRPTTPVLIDDHVERYLRKWYPRALELVSTVRAFQPFVCPAADPDELDPPVVDHAAAMWERLTRPPSVTYTGPAQRVTFSDEDIRTILEPGDVLTETPVIRGRERVLFETAITRHGPLWRYWLRRLPGAQIGVNKLAERLTAADEACSIDEIMKSLAARQSYVQTEMDRMRAEHDARHAKTVAMVKQIHEALSRAPAEPPTE
jgi:hypothetical protein